MVKLLQLAGHAPIPEPIDFDDDTQTGGRGLLICMRPTGEGPARTYRLSKISSATIDSTDGVSAPAPDDAAPVWQPPKAAHSFPWFEVVMTTIGVLGTIGIIVYGLAPESSSVTSFVKTTLLSLVALVIVVGFLQRIDRWEPEPWTTKLAMFLWGGAWQRCRR